MNDTIIYPLDEIGTCTLVASVRAMIPAIPHNAPTVATGSQPMELEIIDSVG